MSDKFVRQLDRMSRDEVKAVNPKVKKKIDKDSAAKSLINRVDKKAGTRRKKKKEKQAEEKAKEELNKRINKAFEEDKVLKRLRSSESWLDRNRISPSDPYDF